MNLEQSKSIDSDMSDYVDSDDYESEETATGDDTDIKSYMDLMDKELQGTSISQSFVKKPAIEVGFHISGFCTVKKIRNKRDTRIYFYLSFSSFL